MLTTEQRTYLWLKLEKRGWHWRGDVICAPNESIWFSGTDPWTGTLADFHERMAARLQRIQAIRTAAADNSDYINMVYDTQTLVEELRVALEHFS